MCQGAGLLECNKRNSTNMVPTRESVGLLYQRARICSLAVVARPGRQACGVGTWY